MVVSVTTEAEERGVQAGQRISRYSGDGWLGDMRAVCQTDAGAGRAISKVVGKPKMQTDPGVKVWTGAGDVWVEEVR